MRRGEQVRRGVADRPRPARPTDGPQLDDVALLVELVVAGDSGDGVVGKVYERNVRVLRRGQGRSQLRELGERVS